MIDRTPRRDAGSVLPIVLVVTVVLGIVVAALATYAATTLRYGQVVEQRTDRLAAAEGGMRDVIQRLSDEGNLCTTGAGMGAGITIPVPQQLNGATVDVRCKAIGGTLSNITSWAVAITGEGGVPDEEGLWTQSGGGVTKVFGGPTYVQRTGLLKIQADLEIRDGNLWYTDPTCEEGGEWVSDGSGLGSGGGDLSFDPSTRGVWCTSLSWADLFSEPDVPNLAALPALTNQSRTVDPVNGSYQDFGTCRVFWPGRYSFQPNWATYNYMRSGDYYFDLGSNPNTAVLEVRNATVTAGRQGVAGDVQAITNTACDIQRDGDVPEGATFYLDRATHIDVAVQGSLEILRRAQGSNPVDYVSLHALSTNTLDYTTPILSTQSGNNKQMSMHGQIWAPSGALAFGEVTNTAAAQLLGGAVVAAIKADASASASGFLIQVQGGPQADKYQLTATATNEGTTAVSVIADLRYTAPSSGGGTGNWEIAINSWRVCGSGC